MTELNAAIRNIPIPRRMTKLPINDKGFPIPWFVHNENGISDFRVIGRGKIEDAVKWKKCWLCGEKLGINMVFTIGPMCSINRVSAEPPSHLDCAQYAVRACPFLNNPRMRRNEKNMEGKNPGGIMLERNPEATALWVTHHYERFKVQNGWLIHLGDPEYVLWYKEGRTATRPEVQAAIAGGLPHLEKLAIEEGKEATEELYKAILRAQQFLPKEKP